MTTLAAATSAKERAPVATHVYPMDYDVVRGVLMLIVMLDHNDIVRNVRGVNAWFLPMTFHVAGFLLLPFVVRPKHLSVAMVRDHVIRYLTPFFFALLGYAAAYHVLVAPAETLSGMLGDIVSGFVIADPSHLQAATGFIVLWFLPALLSVVLLIAIYDAVPAPARLTILAGCLLAHLGIGALPAAIKTQVPQGWLIALYIFPLGIAVRQVMPWLTDARRARWVAAAAAAAVLLCWAYERGHEIEVATLILPTLHQPLWIIATDISDLGFLAVLIICSRRLAAVPGLAAIGRVSLLIYLLHPILYKPILAVLLRVCTPALLSSPLGTAAYCAGAALSVLAVGGASWLVANAIQSWTPSRRLITPRGVQDWQVAG